MPVSKINRELIVKEIHFALHKMKESNDLAAKLYYFSGVPSIITRIINFEYDKSLVLLHLVLTQAHQQIIGRIQRQMQGQDKPIAIPDEAIDELVNCLESLAECVETEKPAYQVLERIANIVYLTTGNGYYLYKKGMLEI